MNRLLVNDRDEDCLPDALHPNTEGMGRIAERYVEKVVRPYFR